MLTVLNREFSFTTLMELLLLLLLLHTAYFGGSLLVGLIIGLLVGFVVGIIVGDVVGIIVDIVAGLMVGGVVEFVGFTFYPFDINPSPATQGFGFSFPELTKVHSCFLYSLTE